MPRVRTPEFVSRFYGTDRKAGFPVVDWDQNPLEPTGGEESARDLEGLLRPSTNAKIVSKKGPKRSNGT